MKADSTISAPSSLRLKGMVMEKRSEEKLDKWIRDKQKHTYVRINEKWQKCDFKYPGWVKK
jgi:peptidyl-prolyl cis-trans isomerase SurA